MRLSVDKFIKDRKKSTERSKRGELEVLNTDIYRGRIDMLYNDTHPLAEIANCCKHKLTLGCDLPLRKRIKPECECCLWIFKGEINVKFESFKSIGSLLRSIFYYGIVIGLFVEFIITPETVMITIPLKTFYALLVLVMFSTRGFDAILKKKEI